MIADWDLWPYYVVGGTGSLVALHKYGMERQIASFWRALGDALYPAIRSLRLEGTP